MNRKLYLLVIVLLAAMILPANWAAAQDAPRAISAPAPRAANTPDAFEPNNSPAAAAQIWLLADPSATFDFAYEEATIAPAGDVDFYKIITSSGLWTTVILAVPEGNPMRLELAALDAAGNVLAQDTTCNPATDYVVLDQPMAAADFLYLRVRACPGQGSLTEVYGLMVDPGWERIETEPNDTRQTAQVLGHNPFYTSEPEGAIDPAGDRDFYRYDALAGDAIHVQVDSDWTGEGDDLQPRVAVMDANGVILATMCCDPVWPYAAGLDVILPNDGSYYIRVIAEAGLGGYSLNVYESGLNGEDSEPDNTPAEATTIGYNSNVYATLEPAGDVDHYKFAGRAGEVVMIGDAYSCYTNEWDTFDSAVYGPNGALITTAQNEPFTLPADGLYVIAVSSDEPTLAGRYYMTLLRRMGDEPDDTPATAQPIAYGDVLHRELDPENDEDTYRFNGRLGEVVYASIGGYNAPGISLMHESGLVVGYAASEDEVWADYEFVLPADGVYFIEVWSQDHCSLDRGPGGGPYVLTLERSGSLYVSSSVAGVGGNSAIAPADIAVRNPTTGQWQLAFDGSDVGITQNINAFEFMSDGSLLLALGKPQNVPGIGKVKPWDVIRFTPTQLGSTTAGTFAMHLKGSTAGLTTSGEKIDAISTYGWSDLTISIAGSGVVPKDGGGNLAARDEDLLFYMGNGKWDYLMDGSDVMYGPYVPLGLAAEDVNAVTHLSGYTDWYTPDGGLLLSFTDGFTFGGLNGGAKDVVSWWFYGSSYGGFIEIAYPGPQITLPNLMGQKIDGLSVGPAWTP